MDRSSPYPSDAERVNRDGIHRNGNYASSNYGSVDAIHKNPYSEHRARSYGNDHYVPSHSYPSQDYQYPNYPTNYSTESPRHVYEATSYSESMNPMDRPDIALYRPRSSDHGHTYPPYDYPGHHYDSHEGAMHSRPLYHDSSANYRNPREGYYETDMMAESKSNYSRFESDAQDVYHETRPFSANPSILSNYEIKDSSITREQGTTESHENREEHPTDIKSDMRNQQFGGKSSPEISKQASMDSDPLDLRKTEIFSDSIQNEVQSNNIASESEKQPIISSENNRDDHNRCVSEDRETSEADPSDETLQLMKNVPNDAEKYDENEKPNDNERQDHDAHTDQTENDSSDEIAKSQSCKMTKSNSNDGKSPETTALSMVTENPEIANVDCTEASLSDKIGKPDEEASEISDKSEELNPGSGSTDAEKVPDGNAVIDKKSTRRNKSQKSKPEETVSASHVKAAKKKKDSNTDADADDDSLHSFHCGYCGNVFYDKNLLMNHSCQADDSKNKDAGFDKIKKYCKDSTAEKKKLLETPQPRRSARKNKKQVKLKDCSDFEEEEDPFICGECGQTFEKERSLRRHMKSHKTSDVEDYVDSDGEGTANLPVRSTRSSRPRRKAAKRKSYDYDNEAASEEEVETKVILKKVIVKPPKSPIDNKKFGCPVCGEVCTGQEAIAQHLIGHCSELTEDDNILTCGYCDKLFTEQGFMDKHVEIHELNGDEKIVIIKKEPVPKKVKKVKKEKTRKYECSTCDEVFPLRSYLRAHEKIHSEERKYLCVVCGEESIGKTEYIKHKKSHRTPRSYECEECAKTFDFRSGLNQHLKIHGIKGGFFCETCNRSFMSAGHLAIHKKGHKHAGTKKHRCQECGYQVYDEAKLFEHLESHINQEPFVCPFCGKLFMKKSTFTKHKKKHSGQNMCDVCGKAFSHKSGLDRHYTTHSGEKLFKCRYCDKSFSQQSNLNTHQRQHSGEKPYMCEICAHSFTNKCSLIRHMSKHTEGETTMAAANLARQGATSTLGHIQLPPLPSSISHSMYALNHSYQF